MDLPKNRFKAALKAGRRQIGVWCSTGDTVTAELLATCGYDWMLFDTEHSPVGPAQAAAFLRTVEPYPVAGLVRPAWNDLVLIKQYLDIGAQTLLLPYVQNADEAAAAVRALRYPQAGLRGVSGLTRASRYGAIPDYARRAAEELCLLVQVETVEAMAEVEKIAAVPGVDGIFVGPADLAASMGHVGEPTHPEVRKAVVETVRRIAAAGQPAGFLHPDQSFLEEVAEAGAAFIGIDIDLAILRRGAVERRAAWGG
jgi:4-hydroxy-2-oxoheptanedioate aldolase